MQAPVSPIKQAPPMPVKATVPAPNSSPTPAAGPTPAAAPPGSSSQSPSQPATQPVGSAAAKAAAATPITPLVGGPLPAPPPPTAAATAVKSATPPPQTVTALSTVSSSQLPPGSTKAPGPATPAAPTAPTQVTSSVKEKKKFSWKIIPIIVGILLVGLVAAYYFLFIRGDQTPQPRPPANTGGGETLPTDDGSGSGTTGGQKVVLQYWGLWEPSEVVEEVFAEYTKSHPNVSVQYTKQSHQDYRSRLQTALDSGNGPDIFRYHATWVPMLSSQLSSLPSAVMSTSEFQSTFYPVASKQLQYNGSIVGIPLMYEGLALFYNKDALATAVVQPPTTWGEVREAAKRLTIMEGGSIKRAGIAMGYTSNIDHYSDILALLALQNGADLAQPNSREMTDALTFYTMFATENVWSETLPQSTVAFARGDVAMIFAPSWRAHEIKLMNPSLQFATMPVPQLDPNEKITWASYWAEGVANKSKYQKDAWEFLKYLSSKEVQQKLYSDQAQTRSFGEIYSRVDLANELAADQVVGAFVADAPNAQGWYMSSATHDVGINDEIIKYIQDAINAMRQGSNGQGVVDTLTAGVTQVLSKYSAVGSASTSKN